MAILIDTSIFTVIRTQIISGLPEDKKPRIKEYLNELNARENDFFVFHNISSFACQGTKKSPTENSFCQGRNSRGATLFHGIAMRS